MDEHLEGYTQSGEHIVLYIEQDANVCYVSIEAEHLSYLQFNFNPDFPQDAKTCYNALMEVRSIIQEDGP